MKEQITLKNTIGLSQEETAMLLGVSRGQCSMFVSGKRDLPLDAKNRLIALLQHLKNEKPFSEERQQLEKAEVDKTIQKLEQDYRTVRIKQYRV
ncbi:MAG: helix-turn-helix transcriptional regulator, partial [Flavobacterium sp.]